MLVLRCRDRMGVAQSSRHHFAKAEAMASESGTSELSEWWSLGGAPWAQADLHISFQSWIFRYLLGKQSAVAGNLAMFECNDKQTRLMSIGCAELRRAWLHRRHRYRWTHQALLFVHLFVSLCPDALCDLNLSCHLSHAVCDFWRLYTFVSAICIHWSYFSLVISYAFLRFSFRMYRAVEASAAVALEGTSRDRHHTTHAVLQMTSTYFIFVLTL